MSAILIDAWSRAKLGTYELDAETGEYWALVMVPVENKHSDPRADVLEHLRRSVMHVRAEHPHVITMGGGAEVQFATHVEDSPLASEVDDAFVQPDAAPAVDWQKTLAEPEAKTKRGKRAVRK